MIWLKSKSRKFTGMNWEVIHIEKPQWQNYTESWTVVSHNKSICHSQFLEAPGNKELSRIIPNWVKRAEFLQFFICFLFHVGFLLESQFPQTNAIWTIINQQWKLSKWVLLLESTSTGWNPTMSITQDSPEVFIYRIRSYMDPWLLDGELSNDL